MAEKYFTKFLNASIEMHDTDGNFMSYTPAVCDPGVLTDKDGVKQLGSCSGNLTLTVYAKATEQGVETSDTIHFKMKTLADRLFIPIVYDDATSYTETEIVSGTEAGTPMLKVKVPSSGNKAFVRAHIEISGNNVYELNSLAAVAINGKGNFEIIVAGEMGIAADPCLGNAETQQAFTAYCCDGDYFTTANGCTFDCYDHGLSNEHTYNGCGT